MKRRQFLQYSGGGLAAAAILGTVGCGGDDDDDAASPTTGAGSTPGTGTTPGSTPDTGDFELADQQVLRTRFYFELLPLDPATIFGIEQENTAIAVYSGLTKYNSNTELEADLARDWEQPDDTTYVINLRENAAWQKDYGVVTAEDVVFSYNRIREGSGTYAREFGLIDSITALDDTTVEIKLSQPDGNFLHQVVNYHQGSVLNARAVTELGDDPGSTRSAPGRSCSVMFSPARGSCWTALRTTSSARPHWSASKCARLPTRTPPPLHC